MKRLLTLIRNASQNINNKTFKPFVARQILSILHHNIWRFLFLFTFFFRLIVKNYIILFFKRKSFSQHFFLLSEGKNYELRNFTREYKR